VIRHNETAFLIVWLAALSLLLLTAEAVFAQKTEQQPIHVSANRLEADIKEKKITFKNAVRAVQGDIVITCRVMTVFYSNGQGSTVEGQQDVKEIVASGNVIIIQKNREVKGERAEYKNKERKIVITGNPVTAIEGSNVVSGGRMVFYVDEERSIIEGAGLKQVEATIFPEKKAKP
jgi:lipopolysaccharide export system protein LptA